MRGALPGRGLILTDPLPFFFLPRLNSAPAGSGHWAFRWRRFHASYDLLLTPTLPLPTFEVGHLLPPAGGWGAPWTDWAPISIDPAAGGVAACGVMQRGLPVGLQLVGAIGRDDLVLRASRACVAPFLMLEAPRQY